jgi:hypothetical protein
MAAPPPPTSDEPEQHAQEGQGRRATARSAEGAAAPQSGVLPTAGVFPDSLLGSIAVLIDLVSADLVSPQVDLGGLVVAVARANEHSIAVGIDIFWLERPGVAVVVYAVAEDGSSWINIGVGVIALPVADPRGVCVCVRLIFQGLVVTIVVDSIAQLGCPRVCRCVAFETVPVAEAEVVFIVVGDFIVGRVAVVIEAVADLSG